MKNLLLSFFLLPLLFSCGKVRTFKELPEGPIKHHLIVVAKTNEGIKARGFSGATPTSTEIFLEMGTKNHQVISEPDGRFLLVLNDVDQSIPTAEFTFKTGGQIYQMGYAVKDLGVALRNIAKDAFLTDKEIDAISFVDDKVAMLSQKAALVRIFNIDQHFMPSPHPQKSILLAGSNNIPLLPRTVVARNNFLAVPLFATSEIALLDTDKNEVVDKAKAKDAAGAILSISLSSPLTVKEPIDADESGLKTTRITRTIARNAESVFAIDDTHLFASFVNYYQYENEQEKTSAVVGPGVIALMAIEQGELKTLAHQVLPYKNPQFFIAKDAKTVWVLCSGTWRNVGKDNLESLDAGLIKLKLESDLRNFSIDHQISFTNFVPAQPALVNSVFVVPRLDKSEIALVDENTAQLHPDSIKKIVFFDHDFKFSFAEHWHDDVIFLGSSDGLIAYDLKEGAFPFPYVAPIPINPSIDKRVGLPLQNLYFRNKVEKSDLKTDHRRGYDAWVLSVVHQKIYPLDFLSVFGP